MASTQRAKVLLLIPHFGGGGAERVIETLGRYLSPQKYEVHLAVVTQSIDETPSFPKLTAVHALDVRRVRYCLWKILRLVWLVRPAVILSGMAHLNLLVLALRPLFPSCTRVVVRQNGPLSATLSPWRNSRLARHIYSAAHKRAEMVICQTRQMAEELQWNRRGETGRSVQSRRLAGHSRICCREQWRPRLAGAASCSRRKIGARKRNRPASRSICGSLS
jgi:hypothetical protein